MIGKARVPSHDGGPLGRLSAGQTFFILGLSLWMFCRILKTSYYIEVAGTLLRLGTYAGLTLCVFSELFSKEFGLRSFALALVMLFLILMLYRVGDNDVVPMLVIAFTSRHYKLRNLLVATMPVLIIALLLIVASYEAGVITQSYSDDGIRMRESLGFGWVTFLSHYYLEFVTCHALLRSSRIKTWEIGVLFIFNVLIWLATAARNSFILTAVFLILLLVIKRVGYWSCGSLFAGIAAASYPVSALVSWLMYVVVDPYSAMGYELNLLLSRRISLTQQALDIYGISPFGNIVTWVTQSGIKSGAYLQSQYLYVDCSYINALINYGWVVTSLLVVALVVVTFKATKRSGVIMGLAFFLFAIHGIVDPQLFDLHYCLLLLLLGNVFSAEWEWERRTMDFVTPVYGSEMENRDRRPYAGTSIVSIGLSSAETKVGADGLGGFLGGVHGGE